MFPYPEKGKRRAQFQGKRAVSNGRDLSTLLPSPSASSPRYKTVRPGFGQIDAELKEKARKLRTGTVRRVLKQAKERRQPIVPARVATPPEGTLGWIRRQGNGLIQMLGRAGVQAHVVLVAVIMANMSNELGETDVGQRRICEISGALFDEFGNIIKRGAISPRCVTDAWAVLDRVRFFEESVPIPDSYDPQKKRRAGTWHKLAMPTNEQLSLLYGPMPRVPDRQQALPLVLPAEPEALTVPVPVQPAKAPHVGGTECSCRPCAAAREAVLFQSSDPVASSAREASQTEDFIETEGVSEGGGPIAEGDAPSVAPSGAIHAATDPIDQPPTRGGSGNAFGHCAPVFCNGPVADNEMANARRIQRENAARMARLHAPRHRPAQLSWIQETAPTATARSIVEKPDGQRLFDANAFLVNVGYRPDSIRTNGTEQNPDQTLARNLRKTQNPNGHPESCGCLKCEAAEGSTE